MEMKFPDSAQGAIAARHDQGDAPETISKNPRYVHPTPKRKALDVQQMAIPSAPFAPPTGLVPMHAQTVTPPGFTAPNASPNSISVGLPSHFHFYDFKDLYIAPFRILHLSKLAKSHEERSLLPMVEAVSSVLSSSSGVPNLGFKLNSNDFYFVLYWLRINSFTKAKYLHTSYCRDKDHLAKVASGELENDSLMNKFEITNSSLVTNYLTDIPAEFVLPAPYKLRPALMQDTLEFYEMSDMLDPEVSYLAGLASCFEDTTQYIPLRARMDLVASFEPDVAMMLSRYETWSDSFGVVEQVKVTCGCGASWADTVTLDAHSFLSA